MKKHAPIIEWAVITIALLAWVAIAYPMRIDDLLYKLAQITIGSFAGLIADYAMFPDARPRDLDGSLKAAAEQRRATFVGAIAIAVAIGL